MPMLPPSEGLSSDEDLGAILARIDRELRARRPPDGMLTRIVAIDGLGGSGKSSFALRLSRELGGAVIVQTDDFATWDNPIDWWPDLLEWVLIPISRLRFTACPYRGAAAHERANVPHAVTTMYLGFALSAKLRELAAEHRRDFSGEAQTPVRSYLA
jgi:hypothetical protein